MAIPNTDFPEILVAGHAPVGALVPRANTESAGPAPAVASIKAKARQKAIVKFPCRFHCAITAAMAESLARMTGGNALLSESDIGRLALHSYLLANDPQYTKQMRGGK
jgi:hypothetical protein